MAITDAFRKAVSSGDIRGVRIMMKDSLLVDPSFIEFNEMNNFARDLSGLYDKHDESELNNDKSAWNDDYMSEVMVQVVYNFSRKRIEHLKEVVRKLRPDYADSQQPASAERTDTSKNKSSQDQEKHNEKRKYQYEQDNRVHRGTKIAGGATAGAVAGGIIAKFVGGPVIIGVAIGAVVVGTAVALATKEE
jgi:hypothetical protein